MNDKTKSLSSDGLTRRDFLRDTAIGTAGIVIGTASCSSPVEAGHEPVANDTLPAGKSKVVIVRDKEATDENNRPQEAKIEEMLELAVLELAGASSSAAAWSTFFRPDDVVGVKINVMMTPTSPETSRSVVRGIMKAGIDEKSIILWDRSDAGYGLEGATTRNERFGFDSKSLSRIVTDKATALVNVPGMKVHWLAGVGVALKNWIGAITKINVPDIGVAYKIHGDSCAECASVPAIPAIRDKSRLVVVDAMRPLFHGGPQINPRYLWPYKAIIVGVDPVAVDAVCLKIFEAKRREFKGEDWPVSPPAKHVFLAETKYRLGHAKMENIEVVKLGWEEGMLI